MKEPTMTATTVTAIPGTDADSKGRVWPRMSAAEVDAMFGAPVREFDDYEAE
jgi:hypothetical protein